MNQQAGKLTGTGVVRRKDGTVVQFKFEGRVAQEKNHGGDTFKRSPERNG